MARLRHGGERHEIAGTRTQIEALQGRLVLLEAFLQFEHDLILVG